MRELSLCQSINRKKDGKVEFKQVGKPKAKEVFSAFGKEFSLVLSLTMMILCNSAVLILVKWPSHTYPHHCGFLKTV